MWLQIFESLIRKESIIWPASRRLDSKEFSLFNHIESSGAKGPPPQMLIEFFKWQVINEPRWDSGLLCYG